MEDPNGLGVLFKDIWTTIVGVTLAVFFGIVKEAYAYTKADRPNPTWRIVFAKLTLSAAAGLVATWITQEYKINPYGSGVIIAIAGYGGSETLDVVKEAIYDAIRKRFTAGQASIPPDNKTAD